jgi:hypothetical protein
MQTTFEITKLHPNEVEQACGLFQRVFGARITPAHWRWKYQQGPRLGAINLVARNTEGEIVAHFGASVFAGIANQRAIAMAQLCDVMIELAERSVYATNTIYPRLLHTMQKELLQQYSQAFAYGFAGPRVYKLGGRLGYYRAIQPYRTIYTTPQHQAGWLDRWLDVHPAQWDATLLDTLWARAAPRIHAPYVARTGAYLAWRYQEHPLHQYQLWIIKNFYRTIGWVVTRSMQTDEVCIVDALLPPHTSPAPIFAALHQRIVKQTGASVKIASWIGQTDPTHTPDSNVGGEFKLQQWYQGQPEPQFQPGDTDVY